VVVRQGDVGTLFCCLASGRLAVDIDGDEIRELGPGDWFGEIALLRDVPRTASVTALTDVSLWTVERDFFLASLTTVRRSVEAAERRIRDDYV
jgi:CRP-like cAMP-binding protein